MTPKRLLSIDVIRAVTMLLMIFVNDVSSVHHIPAWIDHAAADEDRLGFADTIFPAFLFIVGLSLPLALQYREQKGDSTVGILRYILGRSAALIVMGFFHVNGEEYNHAAVLSYPVWTILTTLAFFLIWLRYPATLNRFIRGALKAAGVVLLLVMAYLYKGGNGEETHGMQASWWGILGIIGWAYLAGGFLYVLLEGRLQWLLIAGAILLGINIASHTGVMPFHIDIIGDASSATLVMGGVIVSLYYRQGLAKRKQVARIILPLIVAGILSIILGLVLRPFAGGISKIYATPAWVLMCAGITLLVYTGAIWLIDIKGKQQWLRIIRPAGTSTLICYLLPYIFYSLLSLLHLYYPAVLNNGWPGILRSFAVAFSIILLVGVLEKGGIRLQL